MSGKPFLDTNVLIYGALKNDQRSERAEELLALGAVISVQVLNEFVSVARRKFQVPWNEVRAALQWIRILCPDPAPLTIDTHQAAVRIAEQYDYRIYDSLIISSALEANAACSIPKIFTMARSSTTS